MADGCNAEYKHHPKADTSWETDMVWRIHGRKTFLIAPAKHAASLLPRASTTQHLLRLLDDAEFDFQRAL